MLMKTRSLDVLAPIAALGLVLAAAGLSGCNRSPDPVSSREIPEPPGQSPAKDFPTIQAGEGRLLQGEELDAFLKTFPESRRAEIPPVSGEQPQPAAKSAANWCIINFDSQQGLQNMADRAYTAYAVSPFYYQPCTPYNAYVTPLGRNYYYLPPEETGTCVGSYGKRGYGQQSNCLNQKDASLFKRYASNGSPTDGSLGLVVTLPYGGVNRNFRFKYFFGRSGIITVYAYRVGIGWWYWGPLDFTSPGFFSFTNAEDVTEVRFHASNNASIFSVDNIGLIPR